MGIKSLLGNCIKMGRDGDVLVILATHKRNIYVLSTQSTGLVLGDPPRGPLTAAQEWDSISMNSVVWEEDDDGCC